MIKKLVDNTGSDYICSVNLSGLTTNEILPALSGLTPFPHRDLCPLKLYRHEKEIRCDTIARIHAGRVHIMSVILLYAHVFG